MNGQVAVTNIIELLGVRQTRETLLLCGESLAAVRSASDFELLQLLLKNLPILSGYRTAILLEAVSEQILKADIAISETSAARLWQASYERLLQESKTREQWLSMLSFVTPSTEISELTLDRLYASKRTVTWCGNDLIATKTTSWQAWESELRALWQVKQQEGVREILFQIPADYSDVNPNVYAVEQCLQKEKKDKADEHMLLAQAIRFACMHGKDADICVVLQGKCHESALMRLLERIEKQGVHGEIWIDSTSEQGDCRIAEWILSCADPTQIRLAVDLSETPQEVVRKRLSNLACIYPVGRVADFEA